MRPHTLVIGGTGKLRPLVVKFAEDGHTVSVIARKIPRLTALIKETLKAEGVVNVIPLDFNDTDLLAEKLTEAIAVLGPVTLAVGCVPSSSGDTTKTLAAILGSQSNDCRYIDLPGCPDDDMDKIVSEREVVFKEYPRLEYEFLETDRSVADDDVAGVVIDRL